MLDELSDLVGHQSGGGFEESLSLVLVEVLELLSEDINSALVPVRGKESFDVGHLLNLLALEVLEGVTLRSSSGNINELLILIVLPELHELESGLRADAEVFAH